jgi:hypothetical protein
MPHLHYRGHNLVVRPPDKTRSDESALRETNLLRVLEEAYDKPLIGTVGTLSLPYAEGIRLRLERRLGRWWCVYDPFTWIDFPRRPEEDEAHSDLQAVLLAAADWRRERWATRHNSAWAKILTSWSNLLSSENEPTISSFGHDAADGRKATFMLGTWTAWSRPGQFGQ